MSEPTIYDLDALILSDGLHLVPFDGTARKLIPEQMASLHGIVPLKIGEGQLIIAAESQPSEIVIADLSLVSGLSVSTVIAPAHLIQRAFELLYGNPGIGVVEDSLCGGQPEAYGLPTDWEDKVDRMGDEAIREALDGGWLELRFEERGTDVSILRGDGAGGWTLVRTLPCETAGWMGIRLRRWVDSCVFRKRWKAGMATEGLDSQALSPIGKWIEFEDEIRGQLVAFQCRFDDPTGEGQNWLIITLKLTPLEFTS